VEFRWRPKWLGRKRFRGGRLPGFCLEIHPHFAELRIIRQVIGAIGIPGMAQLLTDSVLESYARIMNLVLVSPCSEASSSIIPVKEVFTAMKASEIAFAFASKRRLALSLPLPPSHPVPRNTPARAPPL